MFAEYGRVVEVRINRKSGRIDVPNFGFVVFAEPSSVGKALDRRVRAATELQRRAAYSRALAAILISLVAMSLCGRCSHRRLHRVTYYVALVCFQPISTPDGHRLNVEEKKQRSEQTARPGSGMRSMPRGGGRGGMGPPRGGRGGGMGGPRGGGVERGGGRGGPGAGYNGPPPPRR